MLYIILAIITIFVYLIYKRLKPEQKSDEELMYIEHGAENVVNWERVLLERIRVEKDKIQGKIKEGNKNFDLENWTYLLYRLEKSGKVFNCSKKNFIHLCERFKHDKLKLIEITKDWCDYLNACACLFYESPLFVFGTDEDVKRLRDEKDMYIIKMEEVDKRFKNLLGDEYITNENI